MKRKSAFISDEQSTVEDYKFKGIQVCSNGRPCQAIPSGDYTEYWKYIIN